MAYLGWLRQRVLDWTGRPLAWRGRDRPSPGVVGRAAGGDPWHSEPSTFLRDRTRAAMGTAAAPLPPRRIFKIF